MLRHVQIHHNLSKLINLSTTPLNEFQKTCGPNVLQVRHAARRYKILARALEARKRARLRREKERLQPPKVWVPPFFALDRTSMNLPSRRVKEDHLLDWRTVTDNVYLTSLYQTASHSLEEIIEMHRETHDASMFNEPDALVEIKVELDMKQKKKNKYLNPFKTCVLYPHLFGYTTSKRIVALCKKETDRTIADQEGAYLVGAADIVKQLKKGELGVKDFDHLICHADMLVELADVRGLLGRDFPSKQNSSLGTDIKKMMDHFKRAIIFESERDPFELDFGCLQTYFGRLNMSFLELQKNLETLFEHIETFKPIGAPGDFITRATITSHPSEEAFLLKHWEYLNNYEDPFTKKEESDDEEEEEEDGMAMIKRYW